MLREGEAKGWKRCRDQ